MSFRNLVEDIENVVVTELSGIDDNPAEAMNVQANADGSFALTAAGGGGGGGGSVGPSGGTFIESTTTTDLGNTYEAVTLTAGAAATTFYISGGVEYVNLSGSEGAGLRAVQMTNATGIVNGWLQINARNENASVYGFETSMVWNNTTNGFVGYPVQSTFHGNAANTFMAFGANSSSFGTPVRHQLSTSLSGAVSNIGVGIGAGATVFGSISVAANNTVIFGIQTANTNGQRSRMFANQLS